jgi:hypothetical protein
LVEHGTDDVMPLVTVTTETPWTFLHRAVIWVAPAAYAMTTPSGATVATLGSDVAQIMSDGVASTPSLSRAVKRSWILAPLTRLAVLGATLKLVLSRFLPSGPVGVSHAIAVNIAATRTGIEERARIVASSEYPEEASRYAVACRRLATRRTWGLL